MEPTPRIPMGLILSGGVALGAYQAGAVATLLRSGRFDLTLVAGSSIGAYGAALLAGNSPEDRLDRLMAFWTRVARRGPLSAAATPVHGALAQGQSWVHALLSRMAGAPGLFRPFVRFTPSAGGPGLYDSTMATATLNSLVDFARLNEGRPRCCIAATDVERGEPVWFDTAAGDRITADHVRASGSLIPTLPALEVEGRLLADGGLCANAPLEPILSSARRAPAPPLLFLIELFPARAPAPRTLMAAQERSNDLIYAAQTRLRLDGLVRERTLEAALDPLSQPGTDVMLLSYATGPEEAGPEKTFDFSQASLARRMEAGEADARAALQALDALDPPGAPGLRVHLCGTGG